MPRAVLSLRPSQQVTQLELFASTPALRHAWQLRALCRALQQSSFVVRVALSAEAPPAWLERWSAVLAELGVEVQFVVRARGRRDR